jgi:hypothetical protein
MTNGVPPMEVNRGVQWNWGTFNVPTIALCLSIAAMVYNAGSKQATLDAKIDAIETAKAIRAAEVNKVMEALQSKVSPVDNVTYRVTVAEQGLADVNRRLDRATDSMGVGFNAIRSDISDLSAKFQVLNSKLQTAFPASGTTGRPLDRQ